MGGQMDDQPALLERIAQMEAELASLRAHVEAAAPPAPHHPAPAAPGGAEGPVGPASVAGGPTRALPASRRVVLGGAAAGAAGLLAGALLGAKPAAATVGNMQFGVDNDAGNASTELKTSSASAVLYVTQRTSGPGVYATSSTGSAVEGRATSGTGVWGFADTGSGVRAVTTSGRGVYVLAGDGIGIDCASDRVNLRLRPESSRGAPTSDLTAHVVGDVVRDDAGDLWYCTKAGTPGTWRKVSGPAASGATHLLAAPVRIYDSRPGTLPAVGAKVAFDAGETRTLDCRANSSGVPSGAVGVILTCMVVNAVAGNGNFTVWSASAAKPSANTMVWGGSSGRVSTLAMSSCGTNVPIKVSPRPRVRRRRRRGRLLPLTKRLSGRCGWWRGRSGPTDRGGSG
ncbi:MAG: hypothetical protein U0P45_07050 [Acidimicrobiales bacterium]